MLLYAGRGDLIEKAGLAMPTTMDELMKVCDADAQQGRRRRMDRRQAAPLELAALSDGIGGGIFKDPPTNLTPTLDTPEAAKSAQWYADLIMKYGPSGILSYTDDQALQSQLSGRANMRTRR